MNVEETFIMIKPDAVRARKSGEIITRIELTDDVVKEHYAHLADKPFFPSLVAFMTSGPVVKMIVSGPSAIKKMRMLMGATDPVEAAPGTIRGDYAVDVNSNVIHGSDGPDTAKLEIERFFG